MQNKIKQLEEQHKNKHQTVTNEEKEKIRELEESLIRATLDKVRQTFQFPLDTWES